MYLKNKFFTMPQIPEIEMVVLMVIPVCEEQMFRAKLHSVIVIVIVIVNVRYRLTGD